jgi:hypothetical protein
MLVADQVLDRTEQGFVERMGAGGIKRPAVSMEMPGMATAQPSAQTS